MCVKFICIKFKYAIFSDRRVPLPCPICRRQINDPKHICFHPLSLVKFSKCDKALFLRIGFRSAKLRISMICSDSCVTRSTGISWCKCRPIFFDGGFLEIDCKQTWRKRGSSEQWPTQGNTTLTFIFGRMQLTLFQVYKPWYTHFPWESWESSGRQMKTRKNKPCDQTWHE